MNPFVLLSLPRDLQARPRPLKHIQYWSMAHTQGRSQVNASTGWPSVYILWLGEIASLIRRLSVSVWQYVQLFYSPVFENTSSIFLNGGRGGEHVKQTATVLPAVPPQPWICRAQESSIYPWPRHLELEQQKQHLLESPNSTHSPISFLRIAQFLLNSAFLSLY